MKNRISPKDSIDAIEFFNKKIRTLRHPNFFKNQFLKSLGLRLLGFRAWLEGKMNLIEALQNLLPVGAKSAATQEKLWNYIKGNLAAVFAENNLYQKGFIKLFNQPFGPAKEKSELDSWLNVFLLLYQIVIKDQYHAEKFLKPDSIVIDAGANIGLFSIFAANFCERGLIYAFEPDPVAYQALLENTSYYPKIKTFNVGLGAAVGRKELIGYGNSVLSTIADSGRVDDNFKNKTVVPIETIDDFVKFHQVSKINFIKIDTEGYEAKIIKGAAETIKKFSPALSMSAYHKVGDKRELPRLVRLVNPAYRYRLYKDVEEDLVFWQ